MGVQPPFSALLAFPDLKGTFWKPSPSDPKDLSYQHLELWPRDDERRPLSLRQSDRQIPLQRPNTKAVRALGSPPVGKGETGRLATHAVFKSLNTKVGHRDSDTQLPR